MHVVHSIEPGGTERTLCRIVRALNNDGMRHIVCTLRSAGPFASALGEDVEVVELRARRRDPLLFLRLAREIKARGVDLVHARNWGTWTDSVLAARLAGRTGLLLGFHGLQSQRRFTDAQRRRARWLRLNRCPALTLSAGLRDALVEQLGFSEPQIHIVPNGVNLKRFAPPGPEQRCAARKALGLAADDFVIGNVGNLFDPVKGHSILIDAFSIVATRESRCHLVLAGYGPLESRLRAQVQAAGLTDRVHFTGWVERVENVLAALDVFVLPSLSEGMSNALLEAMAMALPSVVTDVAEHRRMFNRIDLEALVPPGNAPLLAESLLRLVRNAELRAQQASRLFTLATGNYSFARTVAGYRDVYAHLLAGRTQGVASRRFSPVPAVGANVR